MLDRASILTKITQIMRDLTEDDKLQISDATTADDVEGWDSVLHVKLIITIEDDFGVKFQTREINAPTNVGELVDLVESKQKK